MISGTLTAMITPFNSGGVDYDRLRTNVEYQIGQGIDGLVPVGTTGESPTLSHDEHRKVIECVVDACASRVPVVVGTGSNATAEALELTQHAKQVGADAGLVVNPYYNKPTQEGLYRHFMTIADAVDLPLVLYNIPGRTGITMTPSTVARLAEHANIVAVKEATGSLDIASEIVALCQSASMTVISGDDSLTLPLISIGARGVISVLSNLIPKQVKALTGAALAGDYETARNLHRELFPLFKGMFVETNPIPIKTAMAMVGRDTGELRLPLCEMAPANKKFLQRLLHTHGLIEEDG